MTTLALQNKLNAKKIKSACLKEAHKMAKDSRFKDNQYDLKALYGWKIPYRLLLARAIKSVFSTLKNMSRLHIKCFSNNLVDLKINTLLDCFNCNAYLCKETNIAFCGTKEEFNQDLYNWLKNNNLIVENKTYETATSWGETDGKYYHYRVSPKTWELLGF